MRWYLKVLRRYADFEGRARRMEYWVFTLVNAVAFVVLVMLGSIGGSRGSAGPLAWLPVIYWIGTIVPTLAVTARRLHDTNRSGWLQLLAFIPLAGVVVLIACAMDGDRGANRYGPDPKALGSEGTYPGPASRLSGR